MARVDCERAGDGLAAELFGAGSRQGLLAWLGAGTLLLNNVHRVWPITAVLKSQPVESRYLLPRWVDSSSDTLRQVESVPERLSAPFVGKSIIYIRPEHRSRIVRQLMPQSCKACCHLVGWPRGMHSRSMISIELTSAGTKGQPGRTSVTILPSLAKGRHSQQLWGGCQLLGVRNAD
jgi:hypothetical protein